MTQPSNPVCPANRLAGQTSPYLLQHAHNPVDWWPWCDEALERARREDKPVFLSIGYSACHWCHVMERESFENAAIAEFLNAHFVSIKVDREERPDLDEIYMACVQMLTGSGGWPMSVFLTPDGRPFYGGTYFPPDDRWGRPGFLTLLRSIREAWAGQRDKIDGNAAALTQAIGEIAATGAAERTDAELSADLLERATDALTDRFDAHWGGFGGAPKFPPSMALALLLREHHRTGRPHLLEMLRTTLDRMARGGLCDQLGGGFHRYSTDARWLVPHFEKMLYDNALLAPVYFDAWRVTRDPTFLELGRRTLDYLLADMTDPAGGLHSAQDADSEGVEGKYYVWTPEELTDLLGVEDAELFAACFDVRPGGNWHEGGGSSILNVPEPLEAFAARRGEDRAALDARLDALRARLLEARRRRIPPLKDDKVLTAWNGMAIGALALGTQATGDPRYAAAATRAADFILTSMRAPDGGLLRAWRAGKAHIPAFLEDYAHLACGLIDLYETTFDRRWLDAADDLVRRMLERFRDPAGGGWFSTDGRDASLLVRMKDALDGATPSGTSAAVHALLRLGRLLDRDTYLDAARNTLSALRLELHERPGAYHHLLCALADHLAPPCEIAIVGRRDDPMTGDLLRAAWQAWRQGRALALAEPDTQPTGVVETISPLRGKVALDGHATAYVCSNGACRNPVQKPEALLEQLQE